MSVYNYKKYKVTIDKDSTKTQGLQCGDIVRRQYFDGKNVIYTLMCVIENGTDKNESAYFIGALLDGDAPVSGELLDFVRVTNLFNQDRSGALYLTSSDDNSPFMDVIDGIARNKSLCYPESLANTDFVDSTKQYIVAGREYVTATYYRSILDNYRVIGLTKNNVDAADSFIGLSQEFYQYIENPNRALISYKIKASRPISVIASLGYVDGTRIDGEVTTDATEEWQYKFHAITVDYSGRHLRSFKLNVNDSLSEGDTVYIADLNVILLSSVGNFGDASQTRIGKMDGVVDPVFGNLHGYGGYMQRLYASNSAHISGTLTAGDENGFAATFYAGRIHRNTLINSLECNFLTDGIKINTELSNPTGVGNIYDVINNSTLKVQNEAWLADKVGKKYTFSCWVYAEDEAGGTIVVKQGDSTVGVIPIYPSDTLQWIRQSITFDLQAYDGDMVLSFYTELSKFSFVAPQLESGEYVTQYQPTDDVLSDSKDYGAWMSRGGIGGTIQNPLLRLNFDGKGAIGTRTNSFLLRKDGSGHLANGNIAWAEGGDVTFGSKVKLNWENLSNEVHDMIDKGYSLVIDSSHGTTLSDNNSTTMLTAVLYYNGNIVDTDGVGFSYNWIKKVLKNGAFVRDDSFALTGKSITVDKGAGEYVEYDCEVETV